MKIDLTDTERDLIKDGLNSRRTHLNMCLRSVTGGDKVDEYKIYHEELRQFDALYKKVDKAKRELKKAIEGVGESD